MYPLQDGPALRMVDMTRGDNKKDLYRARLEVLVPGAKAPRVLIEETKGCVVVPAPDRKAVAVRTVDDPGPRKIVVVNSKGQVVADLEVEH